MGSGRFLNYRGSIFLLAILTMSMLSLLFLSLAENMKLTSLFTLRSEEYYQMALMKELFLAEYLRYSEEERPKEGVVNYNTGQLIYTYQSPSLKITVSAARYKQVYEEKLFVTPKEEEEITTETTEFIQESKQLSVESDTETEEEKIK